MYVSRVLPSLAVAMAAAPAPALAQGWEPSKQTVDGLIYGGAGIFLFTYVVQGVVWISWKIGPPPWWRRTDAQWNAEMRGDDMLLLVSRYVAAVVVLSGGFAWIVGWAKGTL